MTTHREHGYMLQERCYMLEECGYNGFSGHYSLACASLRQNLLICKLTKLSQSLEKRYDDLTCYIAL